MNTEHDPASRVLVIILIIVPFFLGGALLILEDHPRFIVSIMKVKKKVIDNND